MKETLSQLFYFVSGAVLALVFHAFLIGTHADRRFTSYNIQRELRLGQTRSEVQDVIARHDAPFLAKHSTADGLVLRVDTGGVNSYLLSISFRDDRLVQARIRGEDGPQEVFADAPPDVNP